jgi:RNA polymerase sigma factor (sigma-70 family)
MSEEELLSRFCETGDQESFAELVRSTEPEVKGYLTRFTKDSHIADDLTQEVYIVVLQKREKYEKGKRVLPWLITIAKNIAIDRHRSMAAQIHNERSTGSIHTFDEEVQIETSDPLAGYIDSENLRSIVASTLPPVERELVEHIYFEGLTWTEAANKLGVTRGSMTPIMARAMERLRNRLGQPSSIDAA